MRIGIDIDGVINDLERYQIDYGTYFNYENNISSEPDFTQYKLSQIYGWNKDVCSRFHRQFSDIFFLSSLYVRPLASLAIDILAMTHEIYILTARPDSLSDYLSLPPEGTTKSFTEQWLKDNNIRYDKLIFTSVNKSYTIRQNEIDIIIEDNPEFLTEVAKKSEIPVMCFHARYNESIVGKNFLRVFSWYDVLSKIKQLSGLRGTRV